MSQNKLNKDYSNDPFVQQFFARIPPKTAATFTDTQLAGLKQVFKECVNKRHPVDIRFSIPFPKRGFYIVLLLGKEKRSKQRLVKERLSNPIFTPANSILLTVTCLVLITSLLGLLKIGAKNFGINTWTNKEIKEFVKPTFRRFLK